MNVSLFRKLLPFFAACLIAGANILQGQTAPPPNAMGGPRPPEIAEAKAIAQPKNDEELAAAIRKLATELAASGKFSGSILVAANEKILVDNAWGEADRKAKSPNKPETAFDTGSIGKLFTQIAILQLVEAGKLKLDDTIDKCLSDYPNHEVASKVTVRQLLLHSSGIPDFLEKMTPEMNLGSIRELKDFLPLFAQKPLEFAPGSANRYSNSGYIVLGLIVEKLSAENYYSYVKEKILDPAGMTHSGFFDREHLPSTVARSYEGDRDVTDLHPPRGSSAGGLQASAGDLFRLVQTINAAKLINKESIKVLRGLIPVPPNAPPPADESKLIAYGISGGAPGVSSQVGIDPAGHYTRVILCNGSPPMAMAMGATIRGWMQSLPK